MSGYRPMGYLFDRVNAGLVSRTEMTGGWGECNSYLGFAGEAPQLPGGWASQCSLLEGDHPEVLKRSCDLLLISLQGTWFHHEHWLEIALERLRPGGRLVFAGFGPDTLIELAEAWALVDDMPHVHPFVDMHILGDAMVKRGFRRPILDADWVGVEYEDIDLLMDDLRAEGFYNVSPERRRTLTGRGRMQALKRQFLGDRPVQATFEIIYGYAEAPAERGGGIRVAPPTTA